MVQKKNSQLILIIILAILIIAVITISFILSRQSKQLNSNDKLSTSGPQTIEQIQKSESKNKLTIDGVVIDYINNTYPTANNIQTKVEYAGLGYAIMNTKYTLNEKNTTKKIYLKQINDTWQFLYESDDTISCTTAKKISESDSVLILNCIE